MLCIIGVVTGVPNVIGSTDVFDIELFPSLAMQPTVSDIQYCYDVLVDVFDAA